jgi:cytochrome c biogenesis protein CcmG/thiol:disulfide interchange protein DsbE
MAPEAEPHATPRATRRLVTILPLAIFVGLAGLFLMQLLSGRDVAEIPSALIGQQAPVTKLPPLEGAALPGLDSQDFAGKVTLVNVWASWCAPCREEHPLLVAYAKQPGAPAIVGLNYKDKTDAATKWLAQLGNPYVETLVDADGRIGIDYGVYGVPETFVIDAKGIVRMKHIGPLTPAAMRDKLVPLVEQLTRGG